MIIEDLLDPIWIRAGGEQNVQLHMAGEALTLVGVGEEFGLLLHTRSGLALTDLSLVSLETLVSETSFM